MHLLSAMRSWQKRSVIILATFVALCLVVSYKGLGIHVDINNSHVYMGMNNLVSVTTENVSVAIASISEDATTDPIIEFSQSTDLNKRLKFQQRQMEKYCQSRRNTYNRHNFTYNINGQLMEQLLFNQEHKVFFCLVEKNGNTIFRTLFLIAAGLVPETIIATQPRVELRNMILKYGKEVVSKYSPTINKIIGSLWPHYFKMMMVRHPLERLLSAYRDKLSGVIKRHHQLVDVHVDDIYSNDRKIEIFKIVQSKKYSQWLYDLKLEHQITFSDFIQFVVGMPNGKLNIHYMPVVDLCRPCDNEYDFYGAFKLFNKDAQVLISKLEGKPEYIPSVNQTSSETAELMNAFYSELSHDLKEQLFNNWRTELEFYYYLYPEERNSHKSILGIDEDIEIDYTL